MLSGIPSLTIAKDIQDSLLHHSQVDLNAGPQKMRSNSVPPLYLIKDAWTVPAPVKDRTLSLCKALIDNEDALKDSFLELYWERDEYQQVVEAKPYCPPPPVHRSHLHRFLPAKVVEKLEEGDGGGSKKQRVPVILNDRTLLETKLKKKHPVLRQSTITSNASSSSSPASELSSSSSSSTSALTTTKDSLSTKQQVEKQPVVGMTWPFFVQHKKLELIRARFPKVPGLQLKNMSLTEVHVKRHELISDGDSIPRGILEKKGRSRRDRYEGWKSLDFKKMAKDDEALIQSVLKLRADAKSTQPAVHLNSQETSFSPEV